MTTASAVLPALIHPHQHCDNSLYPDATFYAATTAALNHVMAFGRKPLFQMQVALTASGATNPWRGYFKTGHGCKRIVINALMGQDDHATAVDPYLSVVLTPVGGAALDAVEFHFGASAVASVDDPDSLAELIRFIDVDAVTEYTMVATFNDSVRVISLALYEEEVRTVAAGNPYFSEWTPAAGSGIYDDRIGQQLEAVGNLLRHNSGLRSDWMRDSGAARTRTSATAINLIDDASASPPTAATPGFTFQTTARNTFGAATVPIKMAVYGDNGGSGSGHVYLRTTGGTDVATVTINGAAAWYTATGTLPVGSAQKLDLYYAGDGTHVTSVYAVSIFEEG